MIFDFQIILFEVYYASIKIFFVYPIRYLYFSYFFNNEPDLGAEIDPGMALTLFPSSILDETRFKAATFLL